MIIGDYLTRRAQLTPDKLALIDTLRHHQPLTYRDWAARVNRTTNWLHEKLNVCQGDRVAVLAMNSSDYLDIWLACGRLGAILQNLNWRLTPAELQALLQDAAPIVLIYGPDFRETTAQLRQVDSIRHWVALDAKATAADLSFAAREQYPATPPPPVDLTADDPWVICYTGGTTGLPKGAVLTHRAMLANAGNTNFSWGLTGDDTAILNAPLFHTGGLNVFTFPLIIAGGASIVCRAFDPDQVFDLIDAGSATLFFGVPTMFIRLQQHPRWATADFSRLKLVISGGAPCPLPVFEKFWERGVDFKTGYGLTEAGPNTFWLPPADVRRKPGCVGFPLQFIDVKTLRPDGQECAPDEAGELVIRGPHLCAGYWRNPQATAAAIHPIAADPSGRAWLHTGDVAIRDAEGYYRIVGRLKEMFISGGENVYPAEIESVLHAHPAVAAAAVLGVPDETWGEVGQAFIALVPGQTTTAAALQAFCKQRLAAYKVPKSFTFLPELPQTGAGKIDKKLLANMSHAA